MDKQTIIVIENDKYVVASKANIRGEEFAYLVNLVDNNKIMFARINNDDSISKIEDASLIEALIPVLLQNQSYFKVEE